MFEKIPTLGLNFDPSHLIWQHIDIPAAVRDFGNRFVHVHAKDARIDADNLYRHGNLGLGWHTPKLPGLGDVNWSAFFSALTDTGYQGAVCIEVEDRAFEGSLERAGGRCGRASGIWSSLCERVRGTDESRIAPAISAIEGADISGLPTGFEAAETSTFHLSVSSRLNRINSRPVAFLRREIFWTFPSIAIPTDCQVVAFPLINAMHKNLAAWLAKRDCVSQSPTARDMCPAPAPS